MKAGLLALALDAALSAQAEPRVRHTAAPSNEPPCERLSGRLPNVSKSLCEAAQLRVELTTVTPFKQPDLNWYFDVAATPEASRREVLRLVENAPESARRLFRIGNEDGKITWWWQRLTLIAQRT